MDILACKRRRRANKQDAMDVDDTLVLILERIDSLISLIHAASTCRRWHRIIADASFRRRYRSLHGPPVAGDYFNRYCIHNGKSSRRPSFVPSSSIDARHFSLDFIPDVNTFESWGREYNPPWEVRDSRGSLLLMAPNIYNAFPELVICEPLTRQYRIIPRPPDFNVANCIFWGTYLVDSEEDEGGERIGMSNFRVLCLLICRDDEVAYTTMFTVGGGDADSTWSEKAIDHIASRLVHPNVISCYMGHALGSCYFYVQQDGMLITYDGSTGKFLPSVLSRDVKNYWDDHSRTQNFYVVDGGDGEARIVTMTNHTLEVFARVDGQWGLKNNVLLSNVTCGLPGYQASFFNKRLTIMRRGVGFVVISPWEPDQQWSFSVDLKTMEAAPASKGIRERMTYPCEFPWPLVLQVCLDR